MAPSLFTLLILVPFYIFTAASKAITRNRCELKLVADYEFFRVIGNENYANAARYLINMIERVNGIFESIDWGLDVNGYRLVNIGFSIKEIKILNRPDSSPSHFNSITQIDGVEPMEMLDSFSTEEGTNNTCLCLLVTAKSLASGVLGLANIGDRNGDIERGICARDPENGTLYRNTAVISVRRKQELMITRVVDLVAAHELGHAFGSTHDDVYDPDCVPQNSRDGRYVMWESANTGYERNHYQFSPCSVAAIHQMLYSLANRCFVEEQRALCGNGILEEDEQCDSGSQIGDAKLNQDHCCTSNCRLRAHALCSPTHSECCSIDCTFLNAGHICQPRNNDTCRDESRCSGRSAECPSQRPLANGIACTDEGKCLAGMCQSFCASLSADLFPCLCEEGEDACRRCCRSKWTGLCSPVQPVQWLPEGSMCIHGQCLQRICEKKATDSASFFRILLRNFKSSQPRKFLSEYVVFIVVIVTLLIWFPCGAAILYNDKRKHEKLLEKKNAIENNVQVIQPLKRVTMTMK